MERGQNLLSRSHKCQAATLGVLARVEVRRVHAIDGPTLKVIVSDDTRSRSKVSQQLDASLSANKAIPVTVVVQLGGIALHAQQRSDLGIVLRTTHPDIITFKITLYDERLADAHAQLTVDPKIAHHQWFLGASRRAVDNCRQLRLLSKSLRYVLVGVAPCI